jgi:predicted MFS family arabinose efflux permease
LTDEFDVSLSQVGLLMSIFGLTGLILAIPAGIILQRRGLRFTGTVALGFVAIGAALGALSGSFPFMVFSRLVEGIGVALIVIVSPAAIAMRFPPEKSGGPIGIWSTATPVSGFFIMSLAPQLAPTIGWRGVWWLTSGIAVIALVIYWLFIRPTPGTGGPESGPPPADPSPRLKITLRNKEIWLLAIALMIFSLMFLPLITYYPTYLSSELGFSKERAGFLIGLMGLATIPSAPLSGWISDVLGSRKWVAIAGFVFLSPLYALAFQVPEGMVIIITILMGFFSIIVPVSIFAMVPEVMNDVKLAGIGMAVIILGQYAGMVIGPPIFAGLVESVGWVFAANSFAPLGIAGILVFVLMKKSS